jgi:type IV fimbrial biogenesis protein FimT
MLASYNKMLGVTLIELMVAMVIFAIILSVGVNSFATWTQNQQVRVATESILNGIQLARGEAVKQNANAMFILCDLTAASPDSSWDVLVASAPANAQPCNSTPAGAATKWARVQQRSGQEGSRNAVVASTGAANAVAFGGFGRVVTVSNTDLPLAAFAITQSITSIDVSNPKGDRPLRVTVSAGGSPRMCDPSPKLQAGDPMAC